MSELKREVLSFGAGCFWGVEHAFKQLNGVLSTEVGFQGGEAKAPTYEEVCQKNTGHAEVVRVEFDPTIVSLERTLEAFFFMHDPTQIDAQGPDVGPQYRTCLFASTGEQLKKIESFLASYKEKLEKAGKKLQTTVDLNTDFYPADSKHQDYLAKNPSGYCHIGFDTFQKIKLGQF